MVKNKAIAYLAIYFMILGDLILLGAIFVPEATQKFMLKFAPDISYEDLNEAGLDVFRVLLGILGSLISALGAMMYPLSKNYTRHSRDWIVMAVIIWVVGDSLISYLGGFTLNVALNAIFLIGILFTVFYLAGDPEAE